MAGEARAPTSHAWHIYTLARAHTRRGPTKRSRCTYELELVAFKGSNNERGTHVQGSARGLGTDWSRLAYTRTSGRSLLSACCSDLLNAPHIVTQSTHAHADEHPQDGHAHPTHARTHARTRCTQTHSRPHARTHTHRCTREHTGCGASSSSREQASCGKLPLRPSQRHSPSLWRLALRLPCCLQTARTALARARKRA